MNIDIMIRLLCYVAPFWVINTVLNIFQFIPFLKKIDFPLDFKLDLQDHRRILGNSTTIIGFIVAILTGVIVETVLSTWAIGVIKGLCAYFGHAIGSFIKRRLGIPDGKFLLFVDHLDYIVLSGIIFYLFRLEELLIIMLSIPMVFIIHPLLCLIGYKLHLRKNKL
ncbi:hypothetical protein A2X44_01090 [candidate division CPR3 bacterium GWF2_35_18]|uniref:CDP-2,3-bis-(O-geranylgeranyl)-sn-glycerol synthase n=1 Tax=candidate division CPR3 bacterium GW2011_GWF2_35_18 TaxID=1618350 RepID=A0A0G0ESJ9_UNCC3|nr:MAG: hypothetical protein UR67_C0001G0196 [candidate division CPR3 bacterium GW2011_GWF2_35_18]KKP85395.1 MAG: hypothetical protein UR87_C0052G0004 [candidate division CPR3 bacterium GW2011_GWE2_35_7]OGB63497.1 MAG: hypothetical protein A2X44_01090 [candidate division CPR3 bacterium GWF2_35_18]OGB64758.1 MAG: hypothetical protein A2250_04935 [candidate division CPR3 bacterium RIFOXYA2_FULL_35_13]OGB79876.1 MAG: hypothetical protein A2011_03950 [candidate division CPR3 bacterium GWE2_35_7]